MDIGQGFKKRKSHLLKEDKEKLRGQIEKYFNVAEGVGRCFNEERRKIKRKFTSDGLDLLVNFQFIVRDGVTC